MAPVTVLPGAEWRERPGLRRIVAALTADGGQESFCGWLKDRYGLSWQIVPYAMNRYLADPDPAVRQRVFAAMMEMKRLDVDALRDAARP